MPFKNINVLKDKERIRNSSRLEWPKETWQLNAMHDPELDPTVKNNISATRIEI